MHLARERSRYHRKLPKVSPSLRYRKVSVSIKSRIWRRRTCAVLRLLAVVYLQDRWILRVSARVVGKLAPELTGTMLIRKMRSRPSRLTLTTQLNLARRSNLLADRWLLVRLRSRWRTTRWRPPCSWLTCRPSSIVNRPLLMVPTRSLLIRLLK